ncbi:hypothetical protein EV643_101756 [Kribbella sp. VKM Ac-2527]|uniref:Transcriptional regulator n=2 Tax=Kribbella caucasensis TaxID=2512215 RepID=A0A4R6KQT1_9ACTN|nr:hypothetical protein EV643_101756 [Kribbella sp. VKM Ac-2527]
MNSPNELFAALMDEAACSRSALARDIRELAAARGLTDIRCDHVDVGRWLKGMAPRGAKPVLIAEALGRRLGRALSLSDLGFAGAQPLTLALTFSESRTATIRTSRTLWTEDLKRSDFLRSAVTASMLTTPMARWLLSPPADPPYRTTGTRRVGTDDVAAVRATLHMFEGLDHQFGGGHARTAAVQYLADAVTPLLHASYSDAIGRQLFAVAAQFTYKTGAMAYDVGLHGLARRYFVQALNLAHSSGDRPLSGKVLALMSHQANYLGEYREAVDLARAAAQGAGPEATPRVRAMYAAMEARGLASIGDKRACVRMMKAAEVNFSTGSDTEEPDWIGYFDQAELHDELAHCFTALRSPREVERHANLALGDASELHPRSRTFCRMSLATSYVDAGDVPRACETADKALTAAGRIKSARVRSYVQTFDRRLSAFGGQRSIADFRERARQILAVAS